MSIHAPTKKPPALDELTPPEPVSEPAATTDEAPPIKPVLSVSLTLIGIPGSGDSIELAVPECRPPGLIADQETSATGVWARVRGKGEWRKTRHTIRGAVSVILNSRTADAAIEALLRDKLR